VEPVTSLSARYGRSSSGEFQFEAVAGLGDISFTIILPRIVREWLKNRYIDEASMNTARGENGLKWESVSIPNSGSREVVDCGILRDPEKRGDVIDYFRFQHEKLAEVIIHLSATVRESWSRPVITATFFGYFHNLFGRHASGGHMAMDRILASPHIDCLCGPQSYDPAARRMGGTGHARGLIDPMRRAGKLWLDEMD
jgi:hypothetical protein